MIDYHVLIITCAFMVLDVISGLGQALYNRVPDSTKMREGLFHKSAFLGAIALAMLCEYGEGYIDLGFTIPLAAPVCVFIVLTEIVSILENLAKINPEIGTDKFLKIFNRGE